jgi:hypothetical protein
MKEKRKYVIPEVEEMELDLEIQLLAGSDPNSFEELEKYEDGGDPFSN